MEAMLNPAIFDRHASICFFPVRHHSPMGAKLLRQLIYEQSPAAILIEGPSDFNDRIHELFLPHELPIAIYSYLHRRDNLRRGAFYPFCIYSPEWQALQCAKELSIPVEFIDLPWCDRPTDRPMENAYSDESFHRSQYIQTLCDKLGVEDFDAAWDQLFEIDSDLSLETYLERCHQFCWHLRQSDTGVSNLDVARETFMAERIRSKRDRTPGQILVITGGFHSSALYDTLQNPSPPPTIQTPDKPIAQGIALTPYTYDRLDGLTGYNAGMPNPGFYHTVWQARQQQQPIAPDVLQRIVQTLRKKRQIASTADLIAVQSLAQGLADLRGHREIWRSDLVDGVIGGLVKEDFGTTHPFLATLNEILRGNAQGKLADGTPLPPMVQDLHQQLRALELFPTQVKRSIDLQLTQENDRAASALLHCTRILNIRGLQRLEGTDFTGRSDLTEIWERW